VTFGPRPACPDLAMTDSEQFGVQVGSVGTLTVGGQVGRAYWTGFVVKQVLKPGKQVVIVWDSPVRLSTVYDTPSVVESVLEYRRPGRWLPKGVTYKNMNGSISFGNRVNGYEQGIF